ncbi:sialic acid-binding Ig-like lectin 15 isoform X3 [Rhincodon typus]|uniref:sialic acid-binding Ig-like lectin 15 isoform X3 n=1 Tax=Rhincodon typus TaxID=259920 RepID=UPI00202E3980|nr:sialic acid-binding Ig-like lectin 15 isoform X3 [Rhincodon typus]
MRSLYVCLSAVLLSVLVRGYNFSLNGWSMTGADSVSAEKGGSAVLPCSFTHPDTNLTLTGSVIWKSQNKDVIFKCAYHSQGELCENVIQRDGGNRFRFVGNLSNKDASIIIDGLGQEDKGSYRCRVELNIGKFETQTPTKLEVKAAQGNVSVVSGTEGDSVTLPCIVKFRKPSQLTTVTWMRKEPYQHIVTFTAQSQGYWTIVNGENRYKLVGNTEKGNATTRINQLRVSDNHTYLCQVEYRSRQSPSENSQHLIQKEICLQVHGCSQQIKRPTPWKRNDPDSSSIPRTDQSQQPTAPGGKRFTISASEDPQPDSCTYASIVFDSNRKVQGGQTFSVVDSGETDVTYAAIVKTY